MRHHKEFELFVLGIKPAVLADREMYKRAGIDVNNYYQTTFKGGLMLSHTPLPERELEEHEEVGILLGYYPEACKAFATYDRTRATRNQLIDYGGIQFSAAGLYEEAILWCEEMYQENMMRYYPNIILPTIYDVDNTQVDLEGQYYELANEVVPYALGLKVNRHQLRNGVWIDFTVLMNEIDVIKNACTGEVYDSERVQAEMAKVLDKDAGRASKLEYYMFQHECSEEHMQIVYETYMRNSDAMELYGRGLTAAISNSLHTLKLLDGYIHEIDFNGGQSWLSNGREVTVVNGEIRTYGGLNVNTCELMISEMRGI